MWSTDGSLLKTFMLHDGPVLDVDWKDADTFATCSSDKYASLPDDVHNLAGLIVFTYDCCDRSIYVCQVNLSSDSNKALKNFTGHLDEVNAICWSPGGR